MSLTKNKKLDIAYVQLKKGRVKETVEIRPGILIDLDRSGNILGIEVLSLRSIAPALNYSTMQIRKAS